MSCMFRWDQAYIEVFGHLPTEVQNSNTPATQQTTTTYPIIVDGPSPELTYQFKNGSEISLGNFTEIEVPLPSTNTSSVQPAQECRDKAKNCIEMKAMCNNILYADTLASAILSIHLSTLWNLCGFVDEFRKWSLLYQSTDPMPSTIPNEFKCNGQRFQVVPDLNASERQFEQIPDDHYLVRNATDTARLDKFKHSGLKAISEGKLCVLVLCGGQASRLGGDVPKGSLSLSLNGQYDTLISLQAGQIVKLLRMAKEQFPESRPRIPWLVMVSKSTSRDIRRHLKQVAEEFKIPTSDIEIFEQREIPTFDFDGNILYKSKDEIYTAPNGNGGIYETTFCAELETLHLLAFSIEKNADCTAKVIEKRHPDEKLGVICMDNGRPTVVEYSELPADMSELRTCDGSKLAYRAGSIANHFFTIDFLKTVSTIDLPYHVAKKKITYYDEVQDKIIVPAQPNGIKLERFIFDVFPESKNFYVYEVERELEFSPLKNADPSGVDCPATCKRDLARVHATWLKKLGIHTEKTVFISPLLTYDGDDLSREEVEKALKQMNGDNWLN
ncbi:putative UDP-N-acetylglucosamine pyrophosphorylase [Aphelenchoides bicaudatus]|nr:putative UDP-N-acetylglucosamine pyrophosphorylase [Aphelenchoides bicaudatus]